MPELLYDKNFWLNIFFAAEWALRHCGRKLPRSAALYRRVAANVSVKRCEDAALERLMDALRGWFPAKGQ